MVKTAFLKMQWGGTNLVREENRSKAKFDFILSFVFTWEQVAQIAALVRDITSQDFGNFTIEHWKLDIVLDGNIFGKMVILKVVSFIEQSICFNLHST